MRIKIYIYTNAVSRGGYEPTTVPITLGRGAFLLHKYRVQIYIGKSMDTTVVHLKIQERQPEAVNRIRRTHDLSPSSRAR